MNLTRKEKISFGLGDFSNNGIFTFVSTYLMYYYTDVACLDLASISLILMLGRTIDAIFSPVMGLIVDKTNTKYGKCRPYLALGILPSCILMIGLFALPDGMTPGAKTILAIANYAAFSVLYAFMNVPYSTMINVLTASNTQRISLNLYKTLGANLGAVFVTAVSLKAVEYFSKGNKNGFSRAAVLFALLFFIGVLLCVVNTKERVTAKSSAAVPVRESLKVLRINTPWKIFCGVQFLTLLMYIIRSQGTIYYAKYYLGNENISSFMLTILSVIALAFSFLLPGMVKRWGLRSCVIGGNLIWCLSMLATWFSGKNTVLVLLFHITGSMGWSTATGIVFVILSQTIDYGQWKTGKRPQGLFTSLVSFVQKMGIACAGVVCSQVLQAGGYVANQEAGKNALLSIKFLFCGLPMVLGICIILLMMCYHLDALYPQIEKDLSEGRMENGQPI
ncbi:MFS transporter [Ruminococcus sp. 5_1_39BFAA]|uniref:MFS transporter n=1 Tax=Ruminococcus sp. 5_1_39BFAA TaxID=457412 RepID=UPI0035627622